MREGQIPAGWVEAALGEFAPLHYGKALPAAERKTGDIPVVGSSGVIGHHAVPIVSTPTVIVGRKGSVGSVHLVKEPSWPIDTVYFVRSTPSLNLEFLAHLLEHLALHRLDRSTAIPGLSREDYSAVRASIPPRAEQCRIVAALEERLSDLDAGKRGLYLARKRLSTYREAVLESAFGVSNTVDNGDISRASWPIAQLAEVVASSAIGLDRGRNHQSEVGSGAPYVKMNNVTLDGRVLTTDLVRVPVSPAEMRQFELRDGDILFNTRNSVELVGKTGILRQPPAGLVYNNNLMRIRVREGMDPRFLACQMRSPQFRRALNLVKRATTSVAAIYAKDLFPLTVVVPPLAVQQAIVADIDQRLAAADRTTAEIDTQLVRAARLRQSILKHAFEGRLVPQDPNDEPASVLLERLDRERAATSTAGARRDSRRKTSR